MYHKHTDLYHPRKKKQQNRQTETEKDINKNRYKKIETMTQKHTKVNIDKDTHYTTFTQRTHNSAYNTYLNDIVFCEGCPQL